MQVLSPTRGTAGRDKIVLGTPLPLCFRKRFFCQPLRQPLSTSIHPILLCVACPWLSRAKRGRSQVQHKGQGSRTEDEGRRTNERICSRVEMPALREDFSEGTPQFLHGGLRSARGGLRL